LRTSTRTRGEVDFNCRAPSPEYRKQRRGGGCLRRCRVAEVRPVAGPAWPAPTAGGGAQTLARGWARPRPGTGEGSEEEDDEAPPAPGLRGGTGALREPPWGMVRRDAALPPRWGSRWSNSTKRCGCRVSSPRKWWRPAGDGRVRRVAPSPPPAVGYNRRTIDEGRNFPSCIFPVTVDCPGGSRQPYAPAESEQTDWQAN
jgi:hypothetical protein